MSDLLVKNKVEDFIEKRIGQTFKLIFFVNKFTQVTAEESEELLETEPENPPEFSTPTDTKIDSINPIEIEQESESETLKENNPEIEPKIPLDINPETELETPKGTEPEINSET